MLGFGSRIDRGVEPFARMFEPDGEDYVFQRGPGHAGIRVTAEERDRIVERYRKGLRGLTSGAVLLVLGIVAIEVWFDLDTQWGTIATVLVMSIGIWLGVRWLMGSVTAEIERRAPATAVRTREEARRIALGRMSWGQLALTSFVLPAIMLLRADWPFGPMDWFLAAMAGFCFVFGMIAAIRKFRLERSTG